MSDTRFLNLDEYAPSVVLTVQIKGVKHEVKEMSVEDFAWVQRETRKVQALKEKTEQFNLLIAMLVRMFPTASEEIFRSLSIAQLSKLMEFALDVATDGGEAVKQVVKDKSAGKQKAAKQ